MRAEAFAQSSEATLQHLAYSFQVGRVLLERLSRPVGDVAPDAIHHLRLVAALQEVLDPPHEEQNMHWSKVQGQDRRRPRLPPLGDHVELAASQRQHVLVLSRRRRRQRVSLRSLAALLDHEVVRREGEGIGIHGLLRASRKG